MVYDMLRNDPACYRLFNYGIEGRSYAIDENDIMSLSPASSSGPELIFSENARGGRIGSAGQAHWTFGERKNRCMHSGRLCGRKRK